MSVNDKIGKAIDSIEPQDGTKERMLANIKRKAVEQKQEVPAAKNNASYFSKIAKWALPIAACFAIAIVGIKVIPPLISPEEPSDFLGGSPVITVSAADEFEKKLGIVIDAPKGASGVEYAIIDGKIAEVNFSYGENAYNLRASEQSGDFSGLHGIEAAAEQLDGSSSAVLTTIHIDNQTFLKLTWTDGRVNYILSNTSGENKDELKKIYELMK